MTQYEKSAATLELPAILEMLAKRAVSDAAKERALALTPEVLFFDEPTWAAA